MSSTLYNSLNINIRFDVPRFLACRRRHNMLHISSFKGRVAVLSNKLMTTVLVIDGIHNSTREILMSIPKYGRPYEPSCVFMNNIVVARLRYCPLRRKFELRSPLHEPSFICGIQHSLEVLPVWLFLGSCDSTEFFQDTDNMMKMLQRVISPSPLGGMKWIILVIESLRQGIPEPTKSCP
ncbi:hypothetical protein B0O99DRAFT_285026 [Bisporella sp. PMI_857]|nr:hypothetical protein B0O99DRAFT_285026 [Bisporella sp. PMI_857]